MIISRFRLPLDCAVETDFFTCVFERVLISVFCYFIAGSYRGKVG